MSYEMIDRFLRNNLDDEDYEEFSKALDSLVTEPPQADVARDALDAKRLDFIADEYIAVEAFDMPTGGDDADVGWKLSQWHMGEKQARVVHQHYRDNLREAIDAAMSAQKGGE